RLALTTLHIVQFGPANLAGLYKLYFFDAGAHDGENTLHAYSVRHFPNRERLAVRARSPSVEDNTLKLLYTLLVSFADLHVYVDRIARLESRVFCPFFSRSLLSYF